MAAPSRAVRSATAVGRAKRLPRGPWIDAQQVVAAGVCQCRGHGLDEVSPCFSLALLGANSLPGEIRRRPRVRGARADAHSSDLGITGSNGTLTLSDVHFIVDEFEMEREDNACEHEARSAAGSADRDDEHDDDCEEFEAGPFFVGLSLGNEVTVAAQEVPAGAYTRLKFKVEDADFDDDDDDPHDGTRMQDLMRDIAAAGFANWPGKASMVASGVFTPTTGPARPFTVYFEAEFGIRKSFDPPLVVTDQASTVTGSLQSRRALNR